MKKVITYGTYDLLHYGHIRLLERAKALGDYLIVGITSDDYDKTRGKINIQQSLMERVEAVRLTGLPDEIIIEEYEGQKIDDILRYGVDIFTVGSDWVGYFDYLKEYCDVVYLERTEGISSSELRAKKRSLKLGLVGESDIINKFAKESLYVNGIEIVGVYSEDMSLLTDNIRQLPHIAKTYSELLGSVDAVYTISHPTKHYEQIKEALLEGKHVLCESPIALKAGQVTELLDLAQKNNCVLMDGIKTAYANAYARLLLVVKSGKIGDIVSVDATCTSLRSIDEADENSWNSICAWGPTAFLPVFHLLGTDYLDYRIISKKSLKCSNFDYFTKVDFVYKNAVASVKVGFGVKSEGELVITGTKGYAIVPAPWWKTDYFETRFENQSENKRFFYQLDGEGIRYEIVAFIKAIEKKVNTSYVTKNVSMAIANVIENYEKNNIVEI